MAVVPRNSAAVKWDLIVQKAYGLVTGDELSAASAALTEAVEDPRAEMRMIAVNKNGYVRFPSNLAVQLDRRQ